MADEKPFFHVPTLTHEEYTQLRQEMDAFEIPEHIENDIQKHIEHLEQE